MLHLRELAEEAGRRVGRQHVVPIAQRAGLDVISARASSSDPSHRWCCTRADLPRDQLTPSPHASNCWRDGRAERRLPQDGRTSRRINGQDVDIRACAPGPASRFVLRCCRPNASSSPSARMEVDHRAIFTGWISQPNGILLVTGPTGSEIDNAIRGARSHYRRTKKIITVEDRVEYDIRASIRSRPMAISANFARPCARCCSRTRHHHDRRDPRPETAQIAVQASLTGHLVFSTLHTSDAICASPGDRRQDQAVSSSPRPCGGLARRLVQAVRELRRRPRLRRATSRQARAAMPRAASIAVAPCGGLSALPRHRYVRRLASEPIGLIAPLRGGDPAAHAAACRRQGLHVNQVSLAAQDGLSRRRRITSTDEFTMSPVWTRPIGREPAAHSRRGGTALRWSNSSSCWRCRMISGVLLTALGASSTFACASPELDGSRRRCWCRLVSLVGRGSVNVSDGRDQTASSSPE